MFLKICGLTTEDDAVHAAASGATALGVIFAPASPRCISADRARAIVSAVPSDVPDRENPAAQVEGDDPDLGHLEGIGPGRRELEVEVDELTAPAQLDQRALGQHPDRDRLGKGRAAEQCAGERRAGSDSHAEHYVRWFQTGTPRTPAGGPARHPPAKA